MHMESTILTMYLYAFHPISSGAKVTCISFIHNKLVRTGHMVSSNPKGVMKYNHVFKRQRSKILDE